MIELEIKNDRVTPALERLGAQLGDLTPAMRDIGEYLVASTKDRFASGKSPEGEAWAPKSETTKTAYRRRKDPVDERPLFGPSGALSGNIYYEARPDRIE